VILQNGCNVAHYCLLSTVTLCYTASQTYCFVAYKPYRMLQQPWSLAPESVITSHRSCSNYTGYQYDSGLQGAQQPGTTVSVRRFPASCHHRPPPGSIIRQFQVHHHCYQFTSWRSNIRCCRTTPLEQSSYKCRSTWFVLGHLPPQTENVLSCSRHQRLVTLAFRRCIQIFLTYLFTYLFICNVILY